MSSIINLEKWWKFQILFVVRTSQMRSGCNERCPDAALATTFCHRRWNTRGREDDTCLMRLKADLSRDRLSFRANDPRPSAARARSIAIACNINSGVLRWGENSISPRSDPAHRLLVGISRGSVSHIHVVKEPPSFKYVRELFIIWRTKWTC